MFTFILNIIPLKWINSNSLEATRGVQSEHTSLELAMCIKVRISLTAQACVWVITISCLPLARRIPVHPSMCHGAVFPGSWHWHVVNYSDRPSTLHNHSYAGMHVVLMAAAYIDTSGSWTNDGTPLAFLAVSQRWRNVNSPWRGTIEGQKKLVQHLVSEGTIQYSRWKCQKLGIQHQNLRGHSFYYKGKFEVALR